MPPELSPAEEAFFKTGELSDELRSEAPAPAPTPESTPAPAPAQAPAPAVDPTAALQARLNAEVAQRGQLEARVAEFKQKLDDIGKPAPVAPPDPATDPLGALLHELNSIKTTVNGMQQKFQATEQQTAQQQRFTEFVRNVQHTRDEFVKTTPDFNDAYAHLRNVRAADLRDSGVPESEIPIALIQDEIALAENAQRLGKNAAQMMYDMAKRNGYVTKAAAAPTAAARIAQAAKGQPAAAAPARAGASDSTLTFEGLRDASGDDLTKLALDDDAWAKVVGGKASGGRSIF